MGACKDVVAAKLRQKRLHRYTFSTPRNAVYTLIMYACVTSCASHWVSRDTNVTRSSADAQWHKRVAWPGTSFNQPVYTVGLLPLVSATAGDETIYIYPVTYPEQSPEYVCTS